MFSFPKYEIFWKGLRKISVFEF